MLARAHVRLPDRAPDGPGAGAVSVRLTRAGRRALRPGRDPTVTVSVRVATGDRGGFSFVA